MQATRNVIGNAQTSSGLDPVTTKVPEYIYRIAILVAVVLLLWTAA
jgi:hypothetical protein